MPQADKQFYLGFRRVARMRCTWEDVPVGSTASVQIELYVPAERQFLIGPWVPVAHPDAGRVTIYSGAPGAEPYVDQVRAYELTGEPEVDVMDGQVYKYTFQHNFTMPEGGLQYQVLFSRLDGVTVGPICTFNHTIAAGASGNTIGDAVEQVVDATSSGIIAVVARTLGISEDQAQLALVCGGIFTLVMVLE